MAELICDTIDRLKKDNARLTRELAEAQGVVDGQRNTLGAADTYEPDTEAVRNPAFLGPAGCHAGASSADLAIGLTSRQQDAFNPKFAQGYFPDRVNYYLLLLIDELG